MHTCLKTTVSKNCFYVPLGLSCEGEAINQRHLSSKGTLEPTQRNDFHTKALLSFVWFAGSQTSSYGDHPKPCLRSSAHLRALWDPEIKAGSVLWFCWL